MDILNNRLLNYLYDVSNERLYNHPMENDMGFCGVISQNPSKFFQYDKSKKEPSSKK